MVAVDAYTDVEWNDDDEAASFASFGDFCDAIMPNSLIAVELRAKKQAVRNEAIQNWVRDVSLSGGD